MCFYHEINLCLLVYFAIDLAHPRQVLNKLNRYVMKADDCWIQNVEWEAATLDCLWIHLICITKQKKALMCLKFKPIWMELISISILKV